MSYRLFTAVMLLVILCIRAGFSEESAKSAPEPELSWSERYQKAIGSAQASIESAKEAIESTIAAYEARIAAEETAREAMALETAASAADSAAADTATVAVDTVLVAADTATVAVDTVLVAADTETVAVDTVLVAADTATVAVDTVAAAHTPPVPEPPSAPRQVRTSPIFVPEIEMVFVKGGTFRMGCRDDDDGCIADERPARQVRLNDFYIGKYPVTQKQWGAVMGVIPSHFEGDDLPMDHVSWNEVQEFIRRLNVMTGKRYRLPTEAEWEYAARGGVHGQGQRFHGHRFLDDIAWYEYNSGGRTQPVGTKAANELGLHDHVGNVWEWVSDWYDRFYYRTAPLRNPVGPRHGSERVYRGQSFQSAEQHCRISMRNYNKPDYRSIDLGFRLVLTP